MRTQDFGLLSPSVLWEGSFQVFLYILARVVSWPAFVVSLIPTVHASPLLPLYFCGIRSVSLLQHLFVLLIGNS